MNETVHVSCPRCGGINRVQTSRLAATPVCGRCQSPLLPGGVSELDGAGFDRFIAKNDLPVLVDFWSAGCGPCRMMAPALAQAAAQLAPGVRTAKLQIDNNTAIAGRYSVFSVPTLIVFKNGREAARITGALDAGSIVNWTRQHA